MLRRTALFLFLIFLDAGIQNAAAQNRGKESGLALPRFVSLRADSVNARTGPGRRYPIQWVYKRAKLPVEIVAEFDAWRKITDFEGFGGWIHKSMLSGQRMVIVRGNTSILHSEPHDTAVVIAKLEPGVLGMFETCRSAWCEIEVPGFAGWVRHDAIWGVGAADGITE